MRSIKTAFRFYQRLARSITVLYFTALLLSPNSLPSLQSKNISILFCPSQVQTSGTVNMLLPKAFVVLGISFPLLAFSVPIKCPPGAPCVPKPDPSNVERRSEVPNPYPGPTHPIPPTHPIDQRSAEPEPDAVNQLRNDKPKLEHGPTTATPSSKVL